MIKKIIPALISIPVPLAFSLHIAHWACNSVDIKTKLNTKRKYLILITAQN